MRVKHSDWALTSDTASKAGYASCLGYGSDRVFPEDFAELKAELTKLQCDVLRCLERTAREKKELAALKKYLDVKYIPEGSLPVEGKVVKNESS